MILSGNILKRVGESRHPCQTPTVLWNQSSMLLLKMTALIIEVFDDLDNAGTDVLLRHGCPQSCMRNPVKDILDVSENMVEILLVLEIFLTEDS